MRPRRDRASPLGLLSTVLALALAAGGCGAVGPTPGSSGTAQPPATASSPAPTPNPAAAPSMSNAPAASAIPPRLAVDDSLLDVLPSRVGGVALEPDPTTAAEIAADPTLAGFAEAIAVALAISPGTSSGDNLAIVSVIRLRPGVFSDAWFKSWRESYDASACEVAGGVRGQPSEVEIGGRPAYVGTCTGDAHTYHVHLAAPQIVVSIVAAGPLRFGELVVAGLAE